MQMYNFKSRILIPLSLALAILFTGFVVSFYQNQKKHLHADSIKKLGSVEKLFVAQLDNDAQAMMAGLQIILYDKQLQTALKNKDREALLEHTLPLFQHFQSKHRITHFYFTGPDRINILRVHKPDKYGDKIDRYTTLEAERSGKFSSGIELGPLGTFTLRVVSPWYEGDRLIGFVEFGEEIEHITQSLHNILNVELYVLIEKKFLNRKNWEAGMRMLGRKPAWDQFPAVVMVDRTVEFFPENLVKCVNEAHYTPMQLGVEVSLNHRKYRTGSLHLKDVGGHVVGDMVVMFDVTDMNSAIHTTVFQVSAICLAVGGVLFVLFHIFLGQIERQMAKSSEALRESEEKYRSLVETTSDWIWEVDQNSIYIYASPKVKDLLGYEPQEVIGKTPFDLMPANEAERVGGLLRDIVDSREPFDGLENTNLHKDGQHVVLETSGVPILDEDGNLKGYRGMDRDISERKQVEEALRKSNERMESILFSLPTGIMIIDPETQKIIDANPQTILMTGVPLEQIVGSQFNKFIFLADGDKSLIADTGRAPKVFECELLTLNSEKVPMHTSIIPVTLDDRECLIFGFVDISERKRAEQERIEKEKLRGVIEMSGAVCHEMNQPLQVVSGISELLMMDIQDDNPLYKNIKTVKEQIGRMGTVTKKLMRVTQYKTKDYLKGKIIDIDEATK